MGCDGIRMKKKNEMENEKQRRKEEERREKDRGGEERKGEERREKRIERCEKWNSTRRCVEMNSVV